MRFPGSDNPVYQRTLRQLRAHPKRRGWRWRLSTGLYAVMLALALIVYFGQWAGLLLWRDAYPIVRALDGPLSALTLYAIFTHAGILFRILLLAANSVSSARAAGSWDLLVLTGVPARQIVSGLWWAVQRATLRDWLRLLPLRVGAVAYLAATLSYPIDRYYYGAPLSYRDFGLNLVPPSPLGLLLIVPLSLLLSLLAGAVVAAIGMLASALVKRVAAAIAIALTLLAGLLGAGLLAGVLAQRALSAAFPPSDFAGTAAYANWSNVTAAVTLSWFDNGATLTSFLAHYATQIEPVDAATLWSLFRDRDPAGFSGGAFWLSLVMMVCLLSLLTFVLRRLARRAVARAGALTAP